MAFDRPRFQPLSFEQANPFLTGMEKGSNIVGDVINDYYANKQKKKLIEQHELANALTREQIPFARQIEEAKAREALLSNQIKEAQAQYAPESAKADIEYKQAVARNLLNPLRHLTQFGKLQVEPTYLQSILDNPDISDEDKAQIKQDYSMLRTKQTAPPGSIKEAEGAKTLYDEVSQIKVEPLKEFAGLLGKGKYLVEEAKNALTGKESESLKEYKHYKQSTSKLIGDMIRKGLITSIAPNYVQNMIMPLADPTSNIWNSPEDVERRITGLQEWAYDYMHGKQQYVTKGVAKTPEEVSKRQQEAQASNPHINKNEKNSTKLFSEKLNREVSMSDIEDTAKKNNTSVENVKSLLGIK